ncbi:MAG TPA: extracellular solute-binding protein [Candidatus Sulfotelmatobacter sp.]|nr:extracellular solute-binding protein [Candidatus Sulfotelmatobacter sp.]
MRKKQRTIQPGTGLSRRRFLGVTAGATAALSFGTFIRSGLGATRLNVLTWSNTLNAMDDTLREQAKQYTKEKGVEVAFEFVNQTDLPTKTAAAVESGAGDIITTWSDGAHLHDKALINVSDIAEPLGKQLKGWTNIAKDIGIVNKVWKSVPWGIIPIAIVYRTDWAKEAGYDKFPDTYDGMLDLAKKMKQKGHASGFALGRAIGDANQSHYPMLWAHGGHECKADGKTVDINSAGTAKAVDYVRQLFKEGESEDVLSWDDSSNNRAFLAGELALTGNAASIYWAEQKNAPQLRAVTDHALWPKGPAGRFGYSTAMGLGIFKFCKAQKEAKEFITWLMQPKQYSAWIGVGEGQIAGLANYYEDDPVWKKDPKLTVIREIPKYVRMPGFPGPPNRAAAESMVKYVVVNMFARGVKGMSTPDTIKQAEAELKDVYGKA